MNPQPVRFLSAARRELSKAVARYDEQLPGLGDEFADAVEHTALLIATHPDAGTLHLLGTRRVQVRRFPYSLIYTARSEQIIILAVAHHRRRPEYWLRRV